MITNTPINIDANNVRIGNVQIKWEAGKAYKTRDGSRAVFMGETHHANYMFQSLMHGDFKTMRNGRTYHLFESKLDIIGPWEEEPIKAQKTAAHCDHPKATWDDDKKIVVCKICGINLADVYGQRSRLEKKEPINAQFATWDPDGAIKAKYEDPFFGICARCNSAQLTLTSDDRYVCAECKYRLVDFSCASYCMIAENQKNVRKPVPAKPEQKAKPSDYAGAHMRDLNTPDNRRPRVSLRTVAQIAHDRAVLRLRQHKLARWGRAQHVRWEEEP